MARKICAGVLIASALLGQTAADVGHTAGPVFEVAAIRVAQPNSPEDLLAGRVRFARTNIDAERVDITITPLSTLILQAYRLLEPYQISGPDWMATQRFDISAKLPPGATREQVPEMLRALLEDRFKLAAHRTTRNLPVYALAQVKGGSKLPELPAGAQYGFKPSAGRVQITGPAALLAEYLTPYMDRPVIDQTGLAGVYQMGLLMPPGARPVNAPPAPGGAPPGASDESNFSRFSDSVKELGLNLEAKAAPIDIIVVDRLEKLPSEN